MENVLAINYTEDADAYTALTKLKELEDQGRLALGSAVVVVRHEDGTLAVKDQVGDVGFDDTLTGGIVGLVIGILGGPIGILVGGSIGVLAGGLFDIEDIDESDSVLSKMSRSIRVGHPSVVAEVDEQNPEIVDAAMQELDGKVLRLRRDDVEAEIAAAEEAQRAAKKEARKRLQEERLTQQRDEIQAKVAELKSKLHINRAVTAKPT